MGLRRDTETESARLEVLRALHEIAVALGGVLEPAELARLVAAHARDLLRVGGVGLYLYDPSAHVLRPLHSSDAGPQPPEPLITPGIGAAGQAFESGEPVVVDDYGDWQHAGPWARALGVRAALAVPLQMADRRIGALSVRAYEPRDWTELDAQTLTLLAAQVAPVLETARLYATTSEEARERAALLARERAARLEAEAAIQLRDEVLAGVSHDLAGPLARIRVCAELVQAEAAAAPSNLAEQLGHWAERIVAGTEHMASIIQELLDVARLQKGQPLQLDRRPVDLVGLVRTVVAEYQHLGHDVRLELPTRPLVGSWDQGRLGRVLGNILDNAVKYSPAGGDIGVSVANAGLWAELRVRDHGLGIPNDDLPRVFDRFFRASNVPSDAPGTGLGLAGARQIVEQHGGTMALESETGVGTVVSVRLPVLAAGDD
jgi:signal transduction histidine kinase